MAYLENSYLEKTLVDQMLLIYKVNLLFFFFNYHKILSDGVTISSHRVTKLNGT